MDKYNLNRFLEAQKASYEMAMLELENKRKESHWIWYIFPQIMGLGKSEKAQFYSLKNLEEARAYLEHSVLGPRLIKACQILTNIEDRAIDEIMGFPDDLKLQSSMTLFELVGNHNSIFSEVINIYFDGERDNNTIEIITKKRYL